MKTTPKKELKILSLSSRPDPSWNEKSLTERMAIALTIIEQLRKVERWVRKETKYFSPAQVANLEEKRKRNFSAHSRAKWISCGLGNKFHSLIKSWDFLNELNDRERTKFERLFFRTKFADIPKEDVVTTNWDYWLECEALAEQIIHDCWVWDSSIF